MDKPGRRKKNVRPWRKIEAALVIVLVIGAAGWYVYETYFNRPPPVYAKIGTSLGSFEVELFPACAPQTVSNFVTLAGRGFYNNLVWHRIVDKSTPAFVIQTGDPNTRNGVNSTRSLWGQGGSNQTVPLEVCGWLHDYAGFLGMARGSDPNSGSSQFYVNLSNGSANLSLDPNYTVFGKVIAGMNVVCSISHVPVYAVQYPDQPVTPVFVKDVTIVSASSVPVPQTITACT